MSLGRTRRFSPNDTKRPGRNTLDVGREDSNTLTRLSFLMLDSLHVSVCRNIRFRTPGKRKYNVTSRPDQKNWNEPTLIPCRWGKEPTRVLCQKEFRPCRSTQTGRPEHVSRRISMPFSKKSCGNHPRTALDMDSHRPP